MRTRSQSRNSNRQQQQVPPTFVEPFNLVEPIENQAPPVVTMDDNRTMAQLLEAPTVGYEDAIVVPEITADNFELKHDMVKALLLDKKSQAPAPVKAVEESCVTCGGAHSYQNCPATDGNVYRDNIQGYVSQAAVANFNQGRPGSGTLPSNTITNPKVDLKGITTRSGVAYQGLTILTTSSSPLKVVERETDLVTKHVLPTKYGKLQRRPTSGCQIQSQVPNSEPVVAPVSAPMPNLKPSIMYPSRRNDEMRREKANDQIEKFYEIFKDLSFEISLTDALILMPKFASTLKALIGNKEKLS
ncbi:hypothetical protein Tco_1317230 [Tanacetum coccineum]